MKLVFSLVFAVFFLVPSFGQFQQNSAQVDWIEGNKASYYVTDTNGGSPDWWSAAIASGNFTVPEAYGAIGDDSISDNEAIQSAINSGKILIIPAKTYLASALTFINGTQIIGVSRDSSVIKWIDNGATDSTSLLQSNIGQPTERNKNLSIKNLTIDANYAGQAYRRNCFAIASSNFTFHSVSFINTSRSAVLFTGSGFFDVYGCWFTKMQEHGGSSGQTSMAIRIEADSITQDSYIHNNYFHADEPSATGKAPAGIFVSSPLGNPLPVIIANNTFKGIGQNFASNPIGCVYIYEKAHGTKVIFNKIYDRRYVAISVENSRGCVVGWNDIYGEVNSNSQAINYQPDTRGYVEPDHGILIEGNNIYSQGNNRAISLQGSITNKFDNAIIASNYIDGCSNAIYLQNSAGADIVQNIVDSTSSNVCQITLSSGYFRCNQNTFRQSGVIHFQCQTSNSGSTFLFEGNILLNAGVYGITARNCDNVIATSNFITATSIGIDVVTVTNGILTSNIAIAATPRNTGTVTKLIDSNNSWN